MEGHAKEWMNLIVRWAHVVVGILWIGASFYFIFLENSLNRTKNLRDEIAGDLWAIHGGGFYFVEKYKLAPGKIPKELHWFKYEAYFTWITGFALLWIVYYMNASVAMVDPDVLDITPGHAVIFGIASLIVSWFVYDILCKSPIAKNKIAFSIVGFTILTLFSWGLSQVLSPRAAYIHVGALLGTIMAGNVFWAIIPAQKAMVEAAKSEQFLDPVLGQNAGLRSLHNNYLTLPVIFIMISNHFPSTYGNEYNWAILAGLTIASAVIKHYWNLLEKGNNLYWMLALGAASILLLIYLSAPVSHEEMLKKADPVMYSEVEKIFTLRCVSCHSEKPTDDIWKIAPNNVKFDTSDEIVKMKDKILNRVVVTKTMPQANKSGMNQEERDLIEIWIYQGATTE
ncbi:MAG TPA: hypothetical protein EYN38_05245 [Flavobacteriales bacterium]|nr:hypothetical protein [Flavobacteriales bacterium]HIA10497.1 hypothetical protein [Flavobacteriales bacterium]HIO72495.1 hypothetical protein [Flavobacteriales bacterium]